LAAIAAALLVFLGLDAIAQRWQPFPAPSWFVLLGFVLLPVSFAVAAALAAPERRRLAALLAASVCTATALGVSLLLALSGGWSFSVSAGWATVGITIGVAAAYGAALVFAGDRK
jgi:hypothetical protein